jgi:hypothetical protein
VPHETGPVLRWEENLRVQQWKLPRRAWAHWGMRRTAADAWAGLNFDFAGAELSDADSVKEPYLQVNCSQCVQK